jgi:hypothetical protein
MTSLIRLRPETFLRLFEAAGRRHETVDETADRILREHLPVILDTNSTLATLGRLEQLRTRMKPAEEGVACDCGSDEVHIVGVELAR